VTEFKYEKDRDGIVTISVDKQISENDGHNNEGGERQLQSTGDAGSTEFNAIIEKLYNEEDLSGVVITSLAKAAGGGADHNDSDAGVGAADSVVPKADAASTFAILEARKAPLRLLEQLPVPVVAAINRTATGGAYELCLACNHRVSVNDSNVETGLPQVACGMLPGTGGVVRLTALLGLEKALPLLLHGETLSPREALKAGLVDQLVEFPDQLVSVAKEWIKANPEKCQQPWDMKSFEYPGGGADSPSVRMLATIAPTRLIAKTGGLLPAPEKILDIAVNSMRMDFNAALRVESRGLTSLIIAADIDS